MRQANQNVKIKSKSQKHIYCFPSIKSLKTANFKAEIEGERNVERVKKYCRLSSQKKTSCKCKCNVSDLLRLSP